MTRGITLGLLAAVVVATSATANAAEYTLKFAHILTQDQPSAMAAERVAEAVAEKSDGRLEIQIFPAGQLGSDTEIVEQIQLNTVQIGFPPTAKLGNFEPRVQLFDLPFIFPTRDALHAVLDGDIGQELLASLESQGLKGICYWGSGFKQITSNGHPILRPSDLGGVKMRTMESPLMVEQYKTWGANPIPISFAEVYNALQQGVAEAQENSLVTIDKMKFYEVQDYLTLSNHAYLAYAVIVNKRAWDSLPPDLQMILSDALVEARDWAREETQRQSAELVGKFKEHMEVHELPPDGKEAFIALSREVHQEFADVVTQELLDRVYKVTDPKL